MYSRPCSLLFPHFLRNLLVVIIYIKWATTRQNQQNECAPSEDSDQPGHLPSLIRVFAVRMKKPWALSYPMSTQRRLWSDWADAQSDQSLRWAHTHFVGFVVSWLKCGQQLPLLYYDNINCSNNLKKSHRLYNINVKTWEEKSDKWIR